MGSNVGEANSPISKITLIGDMLCEPSLLKAARQHDGTYDFGFVFEHMKPLFDSADLVIGNLETPLGNNKKDYVQSLFSFNAPADFARSAKTAGVDIVLTANNHCLDRGMDGLRATLKILDECRLKHTGTFLDGNSRSPACFKVGNNKVAIISYTYGTNFSGNHIQLDDTDLECVNLLRPQDDHYSAADQSTHKKSLVSALAQRLLTFEQRIWIKRALGREYYTAYADAHLDHNTADPYINKMVADIGKAKKDADIVLLCPHVGGQFNVKPGRFSEYVMKKALDAGCDAIIASHPHVVQKAQILHGVPCFFSIGNFCMSPNSVYLIYDNLPEYGIAVHLYIECGQIVKTSFSVLKVIETKHHPLAVYPASKLYGCLKTQEERERLVEDVGRIVKTVTGCQPLESAICEEYTVLDQSKRRASCLR